MNRHPVVPVPAPAPRVSHARAAAWGVAGALAGGLVVWLLTFAGAAEPAGKPSEFVLKRLTELPGAELHPDISPDGRYVLYSGGAGGNIDLFLLRVGGARAINLTADSPVDDQQGTISPDGQQIAFRSERDNGGIFLMGATGESVRRVTSAGFDPAWSADGRQLAYATEGVIDPYSRNVTSQLWTVEVATGKTSKVTDGDAVQPAWSPDGTRIAYWANTGGQRDIWTIDLRGGAPVAVTQDAATDWSPEWSPDGRWLYFSSDRSGSMNIWRIAIDQRTGATAGSPEAITSSLTGIAYARFAADGRRLSIMAFSRSFELSLATVESGAEVRVHPAAVVRSPSLGWCTPAPQADWLACTARSGNEDIYLMRPDGSETIRLMDDPPKDRNPTWSPDGSRIAFMSTRSGEWELWSVRRDGSDLRQMTDVRSNIFEAVWAPDGRRAATAVSSTSAVWHIHLRPGVGGDTSIGNVREEPAARDLQRRVVVAGRQADRRIDARQWGCAAHGGHPRPRDGPCAGDRCPRAQVPVRVGGVGVAAGLAEVALRLGDGTRVGGRLDWHLDAGAGAALRWQSLQAYTERPRVDDGALRARCRHLADGGPVGITTKRPPSRCSTFPPG